MQLVHQRSARRSACLVVWRVQRLFSTDLIATRASARMSSTLFSTHRTTMGVECNSQASTHNVMTATVRDGATARICLHSTAKLTIQTTLTMPLGWESQDRTAVRLVLGTQTCLSLTTTILGLSCGSRFGCLSEIHPQNFIGTTLRLT